MKHPFDLDPADLEVMDLDFEEQLTDEEAAQIGGGLTIATTLALGEEGGATTLALGEEGGGGESPPKPIPIDPPPLTTQIKSEEGGGPYTKPIAGCEAGGGPIYW